MSFWSYEYQVVWQNIGLCVTDNVPRWPLSVTLSSLSAPRWLRPGVQSASVSLRDFWSPAPDHELSDTSSCVQSQHSQDQSWAKLVGRDLHYKGPISQRPGSLYLIPRHPQHYIVIFSAAHLFVLLSISALSLSLWTLKIRARRTETE